MRLQEAYRITTFVPPEHVGAVLEAILAHDPLTYGPYDKSAWWSGVGTEQFEPKEGQIRRRARSARPNACQPSGWNA